MGLTRHEALEVLGLKEGASDKEIKDRFKQLALKWHPDKNLDDPKAAEEKFQKLSAAYTHLKHEEESEDDEVYDAVSLAELLLEMFGAGFMYDPFFIPTTGQCFCPTCQLKSELMDDRRRMMEEESWSDEDYDMSDEDEYLYDRERMLEEERRRYRREMYSEARQREYIRDYHEATAKVIGDRLVKQFADKLYNTYNQPSRNIKRGSNASQFKVKVSSEEASRNAEQLLEAEEKAKREKEKKREKNQRKKKAKKKRKASQSQQKKQSDKSPPPEAAAAQEEEGEGSEQEEQEGESDSDEFDVTSAFIARASKKQSAAAQKPRPSNKDSSPLINTRTVSSTDLQSAESSPKLSQSTVHTIDPEAAENDLAQSRKLASLGNRAAKDGHFGEAIRRYTEAIELYPYDHRYFGNRSYCYDLLQNYPSALEDANRAIALEVSWAKGYYRQGRAFAGLEKFELAEGSFTQALKYDPQYQDAQDELVKMQVEQLKGMGFSLELCETAVKEFGTVQASIDALLAGKVVAPVPEVDVPQEPSPPPPDPPQAKPSKERFQLPPRLQARAAQPEPPKEKPSASSEKKSLWVGNIVSDDITEEMLYDLFKKHGPISSVKLFVSRHCAFINYYKPGSAAQALKHLQGYHLGSSYLLLRYPETAHKNAYMVNTKKTGPVNGNECYFWRTSGCSFGLKCRYDHIPEHKGIDRKDTI